MLSATEVASYTQQFMIVIIKLTSPHVPGRDWPVQAVCLHALRPPLQGGRAWRQLPAAPLQPGELWLVERRSRDPVLTADWLQVGCHSVLDTDLDPCV